MWNWASQPTCVARLKRCLFFHCRISALVVKNFFINSRDAREQNKAKKHNSKRFMRSKIWKFLLELLGEGLRARGTMKRPSKSHSNQIARSMDSLAKVMSKRALSKISEKTVKPYMSLTGRSERKPHKLITSLYFFSYIGCCVTISRAMKAARRQKRNRNSRTMPIDPANWIG